MKENTSDRLSQFIKCFERYLFRSTVNEWVWDIEVTKYYEKKRSEKGYIA